MPFRHAYKRRLLARSRARLGRLLFGGLSRDEAPSNERRVARSREILINPQGSELAKQQAEVAKQAAQVYVFQRTANYDIPGQNRPLDPEYVRETKANYKEIWQRARESLSPPRR